MKQQKTRVRFAPSPTDATYRWCVPPYITTSSRNSGGDFILRIEDTDSTGFVPGSEEYIQEAFDWLGLPFDESPREGGDYDYRQSQRREIYKEQVHRLERAATSRSTPRGAGCEEERGSQLPVRCVYPGPDAQLTHVRERGDQAADRPENPVRGTVKIEPNRRSRSTT